MAFVQMYKTKKKRVYQYAFFLKAEKIGKLGRELFVLTLIQDAGNFQNGGLGYSNQMSITDYFRREEIKLYNLNSVLVPKLNKKGSTGNKVSAKISCFSIVNIFVLFVLQPG